MKNMQRFLVLLFAGVACIVLFGLLFLYLNYASSRAVPTFPRVTITTTIPEGAGVVNQPVIVFGEASDPDGIASAELWVNGARVASQANTDQGRSPFEISQSWIPDGPGNYLFLLRGVDQKGFAGESTPVMIQIGERSYQPDPAMQGQYIVQEGDTIESIAAQFGTTPDEIRRLNPELGDLTPGESLSVPPRPETASGGDASPPSSGEGSPPPPEGGSDEPPHVTPPSPPSPEEGTPAVPAPAPWWGFLPLPDGFICIINPAMCARPIGGDAPPIPVLDVHAGLVDACQTSVSWTDNATDEAGFRVYRLVMRPRFHFDLVALLSPAPGSGARLTYADTSIPSGQFFYSIVTFNTLGEEAWSLPSEEITTVCPSSTTGGDRALAVEALEMTVTGTGIDRLYCYVSLAGAPFERIPGSAREFISIEGGAWNIAEYASGRNKRTVLTDGISPLTIVAECMGWQGDMLVNLGRFTRSHPPEEWDGRLQTASPDGGTFSVTYRIESTMAVSDAFGGGSGGGLWPLIDPRVPAPFNLHATDSWLSCTRSAEDLILCGIADEPGLAWDYRVFEGAPRPPLNFKIYKRAEGASAPSLYYTTTDGVHMSSPRGDCSEHAFYSVSAVVGVDSITGEEIQSPPSDALEILPSCGQLEITLQSLWVYGVYDGDPCTVFASCRNDYEAYGVFRFNGTPVIWNNHCDPGPFASTCEPSYTVVDEASSYNWADMFLKTTGRIQRGNNVIRIPVRDGEPLYWNFQLIDHDDGSDDEQWCGFSLRRRLSLLPARSLAEWLSIDQDVVFNDPLVGDGECAIYLHVRGIPGMP